MPDRVVLTCKICGESEPHGVRNNGYPQSRCMKCQRAYSRQHYQSNKTQHNARRVQNRYGEAKAKRSVIDARKSVPCMDCGVRFPSYVMDFDHREPRRKLFEISGSEYRFTLEVIIAEMDKCDVVCSNCHRIRTHNQRNPPHNLGV